jgi:hypothetical protein
LLRIEVLTDFKFVLEEKIPMPLTTLDPGTALIVIDLQKGIVDLQRDTVNGHFVHRIGEIIDRMRASIDVFRAKNLPVVLVNVAGRPSGRTEQGPRSIHRLPWDGPTSCRSWISNRAILSSPSEAGRIRNRGSRTPAQGARRYPGGCDRSGDIR